MSGIRRTLLSFALIISFVSASSAQAADKVSRAAIKKDLVGIWEMVSVSPVYDKNDPVFFRYQRFVFNPDSSMKFMASEKPFTQTWLYKFKKQPAEIDYSLDEKGIITLMWQKQPHRENAIC